MVYDDIKNTNLLIEKDAAQMIENLHSKVPWVQLIKSGNFANNENKFDSTSYYNKDFIQVVNGQLRVDFVSWPYPFLRNYQRVETIIGHKYLLMASGYTIIPESGELPLSTVYMDHDYGLNYPTINLNFRDNSTNQFFGRIMTAAYEYYYIGINVQIYPSAIGGYAIYDNIQLFDLTEMYGEGNEPDTVENFRSAFPLKYYPTNR